MEKDIKDVDVIKGSIAMLLEFIRKVYDSDIAAIFLVVKEMHEDEKLFWFERRLKYIKEKYDRKATQMPDVINKYWQAYEKGGKKSLCSYLDEIEILKFCYKEAQKEKPSVSINSSRKPINRLWKYSYKQRPSKWVIFKKYKDKTRENSILGEGLTAYAVRTFQKILIPESSKMESYPCLTHLNAREEHVTPECKMVAFFPIRSEDEKIIGLVKIENYSDIPQLRQWFDESTKTGDSKKREIQEQHLPVLIKMIKKSKEFSKESSYEELYGVSPRLFLESLKHFNPPLSLIEKSVFEKTEHLLHVMERKEYVGHKEIMSRVTSYADDIADDIGISGAEFFKSLLEERKKHEELMLYETEGYRDHFMHSFHVFLIGYMIFNHIGLDEIRSWLNDYLKYIPDPYNQLVLDNDSILRIWFLTAFLHDATYVFQKFDEGVDNFTKREWGHSLKILGDRHAFIDVLDKRLPFGRYLGEMLEFFKCKSGTNRNEILPYYLDAVRMNDHGVLSSLWLLGKWSEEIGAITKRQLENYLSALAISFHNRIIFKYLKENSQHRIYFESFPIPFLLAYCDTAQVWGRRTKEMEKDVKIQMVEIELSDKIITLSLFYSGKMPPFIDVQDKDNFFKSSKYQFRIKFYGGEKWPKPVKQIDVKSFH